MQSVTVVSPTVISTKMTAKKTATLGSYNVTVIEPGPVTDSCSNCLTIGTPSPTPAPTSINPSALHRGSSKTAATINGSNFQSGATVTSHTGIKISGVSFVSASQLNVSVTIASTVAPGAYNLFVHNPDGYSGECKGCLTVS